MMGPKEFWQLLGYGSIIMGFFIFIGVPWTVHLYQVIVNFWF